MADSTRTRKSAKAKSDFPLSIHKGTGRWFKKVRGPFFYVGKIADDPEGKKALLLWLDQRDDLLARRKPRRTRDELTLKDLVNHFLAHKAELVESGELAQRTHKTYTDGGHSDPRRRAHSRASRRGANGA